MKSIFKIFGLFTGLNLFASSPILITHDDRYKKAELINEIMTEKIGIPQNLIEVSNTALPCIIRDEAVVHLCIDEDGDVKLRNYDRKTVTEAFSVFLD